MWGGRLAREMTGATLSTGVYASTVESPVLLIGAAHVVDLTEPLRRTFSGRVLDAVAVELDAERAASVLSETPGQPTSRRGVPLFARLWAVLQRRLGEQLGGGLAGSEMRAAATWARERNLPLFLIDDPIRTTLAHLLRTMSVRERVSLLVGGVVGLFLPPKVVERQIEQYSATPSEYLEEVRAAYPTIARVLIDDRNEHMADRLAEIRRNGYGRVVAVVGDAHLPGLANALRHRGVPVETVSLAELRAPTGP